MRLVLAFAFTVLAAPVCAGGAIEDASTLGSMALPRSPVEERAQAFPGTVSFRSRGTITALFVKMKRDMKIEMSPVRAGDALTAMDTTVTDIAGGGKQWRATLPMSKRGTLHATEPKLINATNILGIDPAMRERLKSGGKPITVNGQIETEGALKPVTITHSLASAKDDGSCVIKSVTESEEHGIALETLSTMAPDGLPLHAETSGTVKKGPIDVGVEIRLTRE